MIKSNVDIVYDIILKSKTPVNFKELWDKVCEIQGFDELEARKRISSFYTSLFLDGRFVNLKENKWDLRNRYQFDVVKQEIIESEDDEDEDKDIDPEEEYDEDFIENADEEDDDSEEDEDDEGESSEDEYQDKEY